MEEDSLNLFKQSSPQLIAEYIFDILLREIPNNILNPYILTQWDQLVMLLINCLKHDMKQCVSKCIMLHNRDLAVEYLCNWLPDMRALKTSYIISSHSEKFYKILVEILDLTEIIHYKQNLKKEEPGFAFVNIDQ